VTRALRPARLFSLIIHSSLCDFIVVTRRCLPSGQDAARWASLLLIRKDCRLTGMNGWAALACCLLFLPVRSFFRLRCLET
jgi:hypothetical protein